MHDGAQPPLQGRTIAVGGTPRSYWLGPVPPRRHRAPPPLLIAFHGLGGRGPELARWTGLAQRGGENGFQTVFPDALSGCWDDHGTGRRDGADDVAFVASLAVELAESGTASSAPPFLVGLSNGACFVERIARSGHIVPAAMALVAGTAREASHRAVPRPRHPVALLSIVGTADRYVPYEGGASHAPLRRFARRRVRRVLLHPEGHRSLPPEVLAAEWAAVNSAMAGPTRELLAGREGDPDTERVTWAADTRRDGSRPVVLSRIIGGGHGWPGSARALPRRLFGQVPRHLDATAIVLAFAGEFSR